MKHLAALLALLGTPVLTGCGFQPVYAPQLAADTAPIEIDIIQGRNGHYLRSALLQETAAGLGANVPDGGRLSVELSETINRLGFRPDGAASRATYRMRARYVLDLPETAISGAVTSQVAYSVPNEPFGDISAQADTGERAATILARYIVDDIRLQLADRP